MLRLERGYLQVVWTKLPPQSPLPADYSRWAVGHYVVGRNSMTTTFRAGWKCNGLGRFSTIWRPKRPSLRSKSLPSLGFATVPLWIPILVFGSLTAGGFRLRRRRCRKRHLRGFCINCGYDLRGSADRCPECDTPKAGTVRKSLPFGVRTGLTGGTFLLTLTTLIYLVANLCRIVSGRHFLLGPIIMVAAVYVGSTILAGSVAYLVHFRMQHPRAF